MLEKNNNTHVKSMLCFISLQHVGISSTTTLSNESNGQTFDVPTGKMLGPVHRLRKVNLILEITKESKAFFIMQSFATILGSHFYSVCETLVGNKAISIGISIVPMPVTIKLNGNPVLGGHLLASGPQGDYGVVFTAQSYGKELWVNVSAEAGLMSPDELNHFVEFLEQEIHSLKALTQNANL